jgi:probable rRNA maturation factor
MIILRLSCKATLGALLLFTNFDNMPDSSPIPKSPGKKVYFFFPYTHFSLRDRQKLKKFIESIFRREGKKLRTLNYIFCSDKALLEINRQYLGHDFYTDIISFDLSEDDITMGEVHISVERVRENAIQFGTSFKQELLRVIFHGALHLCGYTDKNNRNQLKMRKREDYYLSRY